MPLWKIAWRSIQRRWLASILTMVSMALGVMLVVAVLLVVGVIEDSFRNNSSLGYDTIVGARGGKLQLTLNTVYYLSSPVENLPYHYYQEFLPADQRQDRSAVAGEDYSSKTEVLTGGTWQATDMVSIAPGETTARFRVALLEDQQEEGPEEFSVVASASGGLTRNSTTTAIGTIASETYTTIPTFKDPAISWLPPEPLQAESALGRAGNAVKSMFRWRDWISPTDPSDSAAGNEPSPEPSEHGHTAEPATHAAAKDADAAAAQAALAAILPPEFRIRSVAAKESDGFAEFEVLLERALEQELKIKLRLTDGRNGKYYHFLNSDVPAIPVCLGDYYDRYRVVGTVPGMFELVFDQDNQRGYEFVDGGNFTGTSEAGVFEAILGAKVAREKGLKVGDKIQPTHGAPEGEGTMHEDEFTIVGILAMSGTPQDRAVFVNMDGFNSISDHIRDDGMVEITSMLIDTKSPLHSMQMEALINEGNEAQAVKPVRQIYSLFSQIVGRVRNLLLVITVLICVVSGISILVSIYNSMSDRKQEIAVMRSLGAGRGTVMSVVLLESVMISMAGGLLGWMAGHCLIGLASGTIERETGVLVSAFDLAPPMQELALLFGPDLTPQISVEIWLIPCLITLAIVVGFLPAFTAYRTDVAKALQSSP